MMLVKICFIKNLLLTKVEHETKIFCQIQEAVD